jgi:transcriptional regulator with XRE-family HTH domain
MLLFDYICIYKPFVMNVGVNIKRLREEKEYTQQQIAELINMHRSNYSKIECGQREISIDALDKIAKHFGMTIDQIVHLDDNIPKEVTIEDKTSMEQLRLLQELEPDEKNMVIKLIETFLTKKKFKEFFQKNVAAL